MFLQVVNWTNRFEVTQVLRIFVGFNSSNYLWAHRQPCNVVTRTREVCGTILSVQNKILSVIFEYRHRYCNDGDVGQWPLNNSVIPKSPSPPSIPCANVTLECPHRLHKSFPNNHPGIYQNIIQYQIHRKSNLKIAKLEGLIV